MECRPVEIKVISASGIKNVNTLSKMEVYVVVSVSGDPRSVQRSPIDKDGGIHPKWNYHEMKFVVDETAAQNSRIGFVFQIMSNRTLGDKEAGRVYIPVKELLDRYEPSGSRPDRPHTEVEYQVRTPTGKLKGTFKFSYTFGDKFMQKAPQIEEPPPPPTHVANGFMQSGYPVAVPYAVPYPPGYGMYGYPQARPVGVAGGVGMGLLIGEMVEDVPDVAFD